MLKTLLLGLITLLALGALGLLVAGQLGWLGGRPPADLGLAAGRLKAPSNTPNSVSSQARLHAGHPMAEAAMVAPLALPQAAGADGAAAMTRLRQVVAALPGATVVEQRADYLYVQFKTRWLGFVDDAEFWVDPAAGVIQVRSASRIGRKDFDVNRARIELIRSRLAAASAVA